MTINDLQVYFGPDDETREAPVTESPAGHQTVKVRLGDVFPWLVAAFASGKSWIHDFEDDEITIPADLHEVILAYRQYQRSTA